MYPALEHPDFWSNELGTPACTRDSSPQVCVHAIIPPSPSTTAAQFFVFWFPSPILKVMSGWAHRKHSWEQRTYAAPGEVAGAAVDEDSDIEDLTSEECSTEMFDFVVSLKLKGMISARTACVLCYWAKRAGLKGDGAKLALSPGRTGGAHSEHFDKVTGIREHMDSDFYTLDIPGNDRSTLGRTPVGHCANFGYNGIADEMSKDAEFTERLAAQIQTNTWGPIYSEHELVKAHPLTSFIPVAIYLDGVSFQNRDSCLGIWLVNVYTNVRQLLLVLRRRSFCRCGCKGWCTLHTAFTYVAWVLENLMSGTHPNRRHDGPWPFDDPHLALANTPLGFRCVPLYIKGDWAEFAHSFGFRTWTHHQHPCFSCCATGGPDGNIATFEGTSAVGVHWPLKTSASYEQACNSAEHSIHIESQLDLQRLLGALTYQKTKDLGGRVLTTDMFNLKRGDRLEPSALCLDVGLLDTWAEQFPSGGVHLVFWRGEMRSDMLLHRCPLFGPITMLSPQELACDELHCMHLGVFQSYILAVFWGCITANVWGVGENLSDDRLIQSSALRLGYDLSRWYKVVLNRNRASIKLRV